MILIGFIGAILALLAMFLLTLRDVEKPELFTTTEKNFYILNIVGNFLMMMYGVSSGAWLFATVNLVVAANCIAAFIYKKRK